MTSSKNDQFFYHRTPPFTKMNNDLLFKNKKNLQIRHKFQDPPPPSM